MTPELSLSHLAEIKYPQYFQHGQYCAIDEFVQITTALTMHNWCHIATHCSLFGDEKTTCIMEDCSGLAAGCHLLCRTQDFSGKFLMGVTIPSKYTNVIIGNITLEKFAILGTNVIVLPNVTIAEGSIICSGSVVHQNTEPWTVYYGNPIRKMRHRNKNRIYDMYCRLCKETNIIPKPLKYQ